MHIHLYDVVLFTHITVAIAAFMIAAVLHAALIMARAARSVIQMRGPAAIVHRIEPLLPLLALFLLGLGALLLHLSGGEFGWSDGWVITSVVTLVVVEAAGGLVISPRARHLVRLIAASDDGVLTQDLDRARRDPVLWLLAHAATGAFLGVVFLMAAKPAGAIAPVFTVAGAAIGAVTAVPYLRRPRQERPATAVAVPEHEAAAQL